MIHSVPGTRRGIQSNEHAHRFEPAGDFIERLEGKERRGLIPLGDIIPRLGLRSRDVAVDLGAGIGYFTFPMARLAGRVVSVDIEPRMLEVLASRARENGFDNVELVLGEITSLPITASSVDQVFAAFVYHEVESQETLVGECARILRRGGRLTVVDFQKRETTIGPPVSERKPPEHVIRTAGSMLDLSSRHETEVFYQLGFTKR